MIYKRLAHYGGLCPPFFIFAFFARLMKIEIEYVYQPSKTCPVIVSWTYFDTTLKDPDKAVKKAKTHFKTFQKEMGWIKSTKIKSIRLMFEHEEAAANTTTNSTSKPAARRSTGTRQTSSRAQRTPCKTPSVRRSTGSPKKPA